MILTEASAVPPCVTQDVDDQIPPFDREVMVGIKEGIGAYEYQRILFDLAKDRNILIVLPTGSGKTLVAVLLIKYINSVVKRAAKNGNPTKLIFFLVPTVNLAIQQFGYIKRTSSLNAKLLHGGLGVDEWEEDKWKEETFACNIFVSTADTLKNALSRNFVNMRDLALVVFDECHNSTKGSPYNYIMSMFYYQCLENERPKIFGMTASPCSGKGDVARGIKTLEKNLDSIATIPDVDGIEMKVNTEILYYNIDAVDGSCDEEILKLLPDINEAPTIVKNKVLSSYAYIYSTLGRWCAKLSLGITLVDIIGSVEHTKTIFPSLNSSSAECGNVATTRQTHSIHNKKLSIVESSAEKLLNSLGDNWLEDPGFPSCHMLSDKVVKLVEFLRRVYTPETRCIVFVERRITAAILYFMLSRYRILDSCKLGCATGGGSSGNNSLKLHKALGAPGIQDLKEDNINVLFSTRVCEEGIDIYNCSIVVRFDEPKTYVSYVQSRGRLRSNSRLFVLMAPYGDPYSERILETYSDMEETIRNLILESKRSILSILPEQASLLSYSKDRIIRIEETGALVTPNNVMSILSKYCNLYCNAIVSHGEEVPCVRYEIVNQSDGLFSCIMLLPPQLRAEMSRFVVKNKGSKREAKTSCAILAVGYLLESNRINNRLSPADIVTKRKIKLYIPETQSYIKANYNMPLPHSISTTFESNIVSVTLIFRKCGSSDSGYMRLGILTPMEPKIDNPECRLNFGGKDSLFKFVCVKSLLKLSDTLMNTIRSFNFVLFSKILRSKIEKNWKYTLLIFPVSKVITDWTKPPEEIRRIKNWDSIFDWSILKYFVPGRPGPTLSEALKGKKCILYDSAYYKRCYIAKQVRSKLNPDSIVYNGHLKSPSMFYSSRLKVKKSDIIKDQPLIEVFPLPYIYQWSGYKDIKKSSVYLLPQFCEVIPIPSVIMTNDSLYIPAILCVLEIKLKAAEFSEMFLPQYNNSKTFSLDLTNIESSLTMPICRLPWNYERLEFVGDSVLKLVQTLHLFVRFGSHGEGNLSLARNNIENNDMLANFGKEMRITDYMYAYTLSRKDYQPPNLSREMSISISDNMIADAVEAIIGAWDLSGGLDSALQAAKRIFKVAEKMELFDIKDIPEYVSALSSMYEDKCDNAAIEYIDTDSVEKIIGYVFKNKTILLEALTHSSSINAYSKNSYQRLEFLGDALLGYIISKKIFCKFQTYGPGPLTHLKGSLVNNRFISIITYNLGIHKYLDHAALSITSMIESMDSQIESMNLSTFGLKSTPRETEGHCPDFPWKDLKYSKALSDVYESITGAIFVDSCCDIKEVERFIERTLYDLWIWRFENSGIITEDMEKTVMEKYNEYKNNVCKDIDEVINFEEGNGVRFKVISHNVVIAEVVASRKRIARELGAEKALAYIQENPCHCVEC